MKVRRRYITYTHTYMSSIMFFSKEYSMTNIYKSYQDKQFYNLGFETPMKIFV